MHLYTLYFNSPNHQLRTAQFDSCINSVLFSLVHWTSPSTWKGSTTKRWPSTASTFTSPRRDKAQTSSSSSTASLIYGTRGVTRSSPSQPQAIVQWPQISEATVAPTRRRRSPPTQSTTWSATLCPWSTRWVWQRYLWWATTGVLGLHGTSACSGPTRWRLMCVCRCSFSRETLRWSRWPPCVASLEMITICADFRSGPSLLPSDMDLLAS